MKLALLFSIAINCVRAQDLEWNISPQYDIDKEGVMYIPEVIHPIWIKFHKEGEKNIIILWRDRDGNQGKAVRVFEIQKGREYIFMIGHSDPESVGLTPIQRFKILDNGSVTGVTITSSNIVDWTGKMIQ